MAQPQSPFTRKLYEVGSLEDHSGPRSPRSPRRDVPGSPGNISVGNTSLGNNSLGDTSIGSLSGVSLSGSLPSTPKQYQYREKSSNVNFKASPSTPKSFSSRESNLHETPNQQLSQALQSPAGSQTGTPTGRWVHPSISAVKQRSGVSKEVLIKRVFYNIMSWLVFVLVRSFVQRVFNEWVQPFIDQSIIPQDDSNVWKYSMYAQYAIQGLFATNIIQALFHIVQPQDKFGDLPLTAEQRELMGLPQVASAQKLDKSSIPSPPKFVRHSPGAMNFPKPSSLGGRSRSNSSSSLGNLSVGSISGSPGNASVDLGNMSLGPSVSPLKRFQHGQSPLKSRNSVVSSIAGVGSSPLGNSSSVNKSIMLNKGVNGVNKSIHSSTANSTSNMSMNTSLSQSTPINPASAATPKSKLSQSQSFTPTGRYMYYSDSPRK